MLLQSTGNCFIVAAFYLNRNYIASTLCINRFDLIPVCKGSCFLEQKMKENSQQQGNTNSIRYKEITLFCQPYERIPAKQLSSESLITFGDYRSPHFPRQLLSQVFRPPVPAV
ncbi:hypothetical protein [Chitinophaga sp. RAB17]|uniref:hypothetical protein n=1 Tax=Chitinophaga sp. RAB17 TaxID=3233049 RepID=UPI003F91436A